MRGFESAGSAQRLLSNTYNTSTFNVISYQQGLTEADIGYEQVERGSHGCLKNIQEQNFGVILSTT
jgi:hypothetical protein